MGVLAIATWSSIPFALIALATLYFRANYAKLSHFKGPPLATVSRVYLFWQEVNARVNKSQIAALKKYGTHSIYQKYAGKIAIN